MNHLRIYPDNEEYAAVEMSHPTRLNSNCSRCELSHNARTICLPADGEAGGILVVGDFPSKDDDNTGRPFVGRIGSFVRHTLSGLWQGPIAYDNAVRCLPRGTPTVEEVGMCRGYLAQTLHEAKPERILCMGSSAILSVLGRAVAPFSVRRGFSFLHNETPVFTMINPAAAMRNRFVRKWFESDLKWALKANPTPAWGTEAAIISTPAEAEQAVAEIRKWGWFSYDTETSGAMFDSFFEIIALGISKEDSNPIYVWDRAGMKDPGMTAPLKRLMTDPTIKKVGHNLKYDMLAVRCGLGVVVKGIGGDTMLWRRMLDSEAERKLKTCAELVGMGGHKEEAREALITARKAIAKARITSKGAAFLPGLTDPAIEAACRLPGLKADKFAYALVKRPTLLRYNALDTLATAKLAKVLKQRLNAQPRIKRVWDALVKPAIPAMEQVEAWGMPVDRQKVRHLQDHLDLEIRNLENLWLIYGNFNPASTKDVSRMLFTDLGLQSTKLTKTGKPSTDREALEGLKAQHPFVSQLLEYRRLTKLKGTYADGLIEHIRADGRIHPNIKLDGARSGRLSCSEPNLQNIPRGDSDEAKMVKQCFAAGKGKILLQADFSQLELRIAAMLSGDPLMKQIFEEGVDYHLRTAQMISQAAWGIPPEKVQSVHRSQAKTVNFGVLYGMAAPTLAKKIGCDIRTAEAVMKAIFGKFKKLDEWCQYQLREARRNGDTWTWWDGELARRRTLHDIASPDDERRSTAEHSSWNTPVQGTASDFCLASVVAIVNWIIEEAVPAKVCITVHDSVVLEVEKDALEEVAWKVNDIMTSWPSEGVPIRVDLEVGPSWGELESYAVPA